MVNYHGQIVLDVLKKVDAPIAIHKIVYAVAKKCGLSPGEIRENVKNTLYEGVRHGFLHRVDRKYIAAAQVDNEEGNKAQERIIINDEDEAEDVSRRRPRRRSNSRRSRRSLSRLHQSKRSRSKMASTYMNLLV